MSRIHLFALLALTSCSFAHADIKSEIEDIASVIEANYFDAQRASQIASDLRKTASSGEFDRYADRSALAKELTQRLRKLDGHFGVRWQGGDAQAGQAPRRRRSEPPESRINYGFKRIERLPGNIAYIQLPYTAHIDFKDSRSAAKRAADAALTLTHEADAVILDIRNNGGGSPAMVGYIVSAFIDAKANVYNTFHSRKGPVLSERPEIPYDAPMLSVPLFVLVNGGTASAAESIAFTLQTAKRATVVGTRTAGAANPGEAFPTASGYSVFVATGAPRNPINGRNWEGVGVQPDVQASDEHALARAQELALEKVLSGSIAGVDREDAQTALEAIRSAAKEPPNKQ
jgi:Peptidase family S41